MPLTSFRFDPSLTRKFIDFGYSLFRKDTRMITHPSVPARRLPGKMGHSVYQRFLGLTAIIGLSLFIGVDLRAGDPSSGRFRPPGLFSLSSAHRPAAGANRFRLVDRQGGAPTDSDSEVRPPKKLGRAVLEYFAVIAVPQALYWAKYRGVTKPWHYRLTWEDQSERFFTFRAWKFDSNYFFLNWMHGPTGALYYNIARSNHLNRFESLLFTLGGSFYWEYITEWRNVISINDNIFTVLGGVPIGETWYVLGKYFLSKPGIINGLLSFLNPVLKFNRWLDRKAVPALSREPDPGWHDFRLSLGGWTNPARGRERSGLNLFTGVDAQLLSIPDAEKPGDLRQKVGSTLFSEMSFDMITAGGRVDEIGFFFRSVYVGSFRKNIGPDLNGYRFYVGLGSAFSYFKQRSVAFYDSGRIVVKDIQLLKLEEPRNFRDKFATAHVLGPVFDLTVRRGRFRARVMADAYLDFSLVNALALNDYSATRDITGAKTTLVYYGYYYGIGGSLSLRLDLDFGPLEFRGLFRGHAWGSIEGRDHFQKEVRDDFHLADSRTSLRLSAGYRFGTSPLVLVLAYENIGRRGSLKDVLKKETESRFFAGILFRF
ncbi:MAG: DUF3943 domain-containing protein [Candidatus Aminicenantes bacterium]|nr:DUF3943 domain-containing protein [Candidatus Aminicenantes bacterium]